MSLAKVCIAQLSGELTGTGLVESEERKLGAVACEHNSGTHWSGSQGNYGQVPAKVGLSMGARAQALQHALQQFTARFKLERGAQWCEAECTPARSPDLPGAFCQTCTTGAGMWHGDIACCAEPMDLFLADAHAIHSLHPRESKQRGAHCCTAFSAAHGSSAVMCARRCVLSAARLACSEMPTEAKSEMMAMRFAPRWNALQHA
jgi:hypothetical protein